MPNCLVDYVVVSEFDIDKGSTVRHQYPCAIPDVETDWLSEHMIAEGIHARANDVTYAILNRDEESFVETILSPTISVSKEEKGGEEEKTTATNNNKKYLLYGINVVCTRHDITVRRGATVKSIAIFSKFSFVESFKPVLLIALDECFNNSGIEVLENLYNAINAMNLSEFPLASRVEQVLMSQYVFQPHIYAPNNWCVEAPVTIKTSNTENEEETKQTLLLKFPRHLSTDDIGDTNVTRLVSLLKKDTMTIYNCILREQRIIFVGHQHAARDIAQLVLSAVAMMNPFLPGIIKRAHPYVNLTDLSFLKQPGFIAGATNPMFEHRKEWWDVVIVLDASGAAKLSIKSQSELMGTPVRNNTTNKIEDAQGALKVTNITTTNNGKDFVDIGRSTPSRSLEEDGTHNPTSETVSRSSSAARLFDDISVLELERLERQVDLHFIQALVSEIDAGQLVEEQVRRRFLDFTGAIIAQASDDQSLFAPDKPLSTASMKLCQANYLRATALKSSPEFFAYLRAVYHVLDHNAIEKSVRETDNSPGQNFDQDTSTTHENEDENNENVGIDVDGDVQEIPAISKIDTKFTNLWTMVTIRTHIRRLLCGDQMHWAEAEIIYSELAAALTEERALQFLMYLLPEDSHGLHILAMGCFCVSPAVKRYTSIILDRIQDFPSTTQAFTALSQTIKGMYLQIKRKIEDNTLTEEEEEFAQREGEMMREKAATEMKPVQSLELFDFMMMD